MIGMGLLRSVFDDPAIERGAVNATYLRAIRRVRITLAKEAIIGSTDQRKRGLQPNYFSRSTAPLKGDIRLCLKTQ